jgi:hypothetical protein
MFGESTVEMARYCNGTRQPSNLSGIQVCLASRRIAVELLAKTTGRRVKGERNLSNESDLAVSKLRRQASLRLMASKLSLP